MLRSSGVHVVLSFAVTLSACSDEGSTEERSDQATDSESADSDDEASSETGEQQDSYHATIRRTSHGVAHISADDWGSLAFGQGYAFTQDKGCLLADQIVKIRSQRARWFGPGESNANIYSDFAYLHLGLYATATAEFDNLSERVQEVIRGYAAGYNEALADGQIGGSCDGEQWLPTTIEPVDLLAYYLDLGLLASGRNLIQAIGSAQPPGSGNPPEPAPHYSIVNGHRGRLGSNGWAFGSELSSTGRGMVMGNPHFPWEGELQLWESHLIIPGEFEVYGVSLLGVPGVLIGFNEHVAWTHTVSDGHRLTLYEISSPPGQPTKYHYDDEVRDMQSQQYTIEVLQGDGSIAQQTRTLWRSHYGPMLALAPFYWTEAFALSYRDANIDNLALIEQFLRMNTSTSLEQFQQVHHQVNGIPWVNTMAASADGRAWYMDSTPTPKLSQAAIGAWYERRSQTGFTKAFADQDVWLLQGFDSRDEWQDDPGARSPGLIAPANLPQLERTDFIFNSNDSYWLSNPLEPLTGYSPLHGFAETARSMRTRMNAKTLLEIAEGGGFAGADGKLDLSELGEAALANRGFAQELLRDEVIARCTGVGVWEVDGQMVDIAEACDLLAAWDGLLNLDSVGAIIWREWLGDYDAKLFTESGPLLAIPFDPADPIDTPAGLAAGDLDKDRALDALARAVRRLDGAGLALDTPFGEAQFARKGDAIIPIHGGISAEGVTNLMVYDQLRSDLEPPTPRAEELWAATGLTTDGYQVNYGTSFIMCVQFTDDGPQAQALLSYSQSAEPDSPWFADQTQLFSQKQWRPILWREQDIAADPNLIEYQVSG